VVGGFFALFLGWVFYALFVRTRLRIDQQRIYFFKELFGLKWQRSHPLYKQDSCQVELTQQYFKTNSMGENIWISQRLMIRVGEQQYQLVEKGRLTDLELDWLAHELREWLSLQIKH
jgi:hypothetical protein